MKASLYKIKSAIADPKTKAVSFDVFDTLLVRPFGLPTDLFYFLDIELQNILGTHGAVSFSTVRHEAEVEVRKRTNTDGKEDVTLQEIYDYIADTNILPADIVHVLMHKELDLELRFCNARKSAKRLVEFAVEKGKTVIATSDMYLSSSFIGELLAKNGFMEVSSIFVSCEAGVTKESGHLYLHVLEHLQLQKDEVIHIGDNPKADIVVPRRLGIRAFPFHRTMDLLAGENGTGKGKAFKKAYKQLRSPFSNHKVLEKIGVRCMLAVVANRVYDDPFRHSNTDGSYADNVELFGCMALGMYCMAQAIWVDRIAREEGIDRVLFFSRDGYLPYVGFQMLQSIKDNKDDKKIEATYARVSRKAVVPLLLASRNLLLTAGTHLNYYSHSPQSIVKIMKPVLKDSSVNLATELGSKWKSGFLSELSMMEFLDILFNQYVDIQKLKAVKKGFTCYFEPYMKGNILTYDIGYSLRNEAILKEFFPDVKLTASCTHITGDIPIKRAIQGDVNLHTFYPTTPYVTWLARETFLIENAPSCVGYSPDGKPVMQKEEEQQDLLQSMHKEAIHYMRDFTDLFSADIKNLPIDCLDACFPFEAFLHSPDTAEKKWVKDLGAIDSIDTGVKDYKSYNFWRELRTDYWIANHHLGEYGRHVVRFIMLTYTDREELKQLIRKRLPEGFK